MRATSQALTISRRFHDDGTCWRDDAGVALADALRDAGASRDIDHRPHGEVHRWTLSDGSVITIADGGWDLGYPDCYCWAGAGHDEEYCQRGRVSAKAIGRKGGSAGTGEAKRRTREQYQEMARRSAETRRKA